MGCARDREKKGTESKRCLHSLRPKAVAGMSAVVRWVYGRNTGDLPIMKRSEMTPSPPLIISSGVASGVAWGVQRDVPGERRFLGRGSCA